ncbi:MAG TPA: PQQ-binding-like beta-propeller repeat protein, partial [Anaerolineae bacterium]|nr:PQQ-binding-like beta-propeller repeat protein [Anaerolineae bacterium]
MKVFRGICAAFLVVLMSTASTAHASSWPMFQYDAQHTGFSPDERIRPPLEHSWTKWPEEMYDEGRTRPVVADGVVYVGQVWHLYNFGDYVGTRGQLQAISLSTGVPMWAVKDLLVCSTPMLSNGRIYFGTQDGKFYALSATDGSVIWSFDAGSLPTAPTMLGDYIYFGTFDGRLYALNAGTGEQRWMLERPPNSLSAPAIANNTLFVGGSELLAVDPSTGDVKWSFRDSLGPCSAPVVKGGSVFVSCPYTLYCLNSGDGSIRWSYFTADYHGDMVTPSVSDSTLYWGTVTAIDPATGQVKWTFDSQNDILSSSVAIANGYVFVGSSHDTGGVFDHSDGRLYVLREDTGELVWQYL